MSKEPGALHLYQSGLAEEIRQSDQHVRGAEYQPHRRLRCDQMLTEWHQLSQR